MVVCAYIEWIVMPGGGKGITLHDAAGKPLGDALGRQSVSSAVFCYRSRVWARFGTLRCVSGRRLVLSGH